MHQEVSLGEPLIKAGRDENMGDITFSDTKIMLLCSNKAWSILCVSYIRSQPYGHMSIKTFKGSRFNCFVKNNFIG